MVDSRGNPVELESLEGKIVGLYFSAEWCPPCRKFTPELVKFRDRNKNNFEVVFVSSDKTEEALFDYMKSTRMRWPALPFGSEKKGELSEKFGISGIPSLVIVDSQGNLITKNGRADVNENGNRALRDWQKAASESSGSCATASSSCETESSSSEGCSQ